MFLSIFIRTYVLFFQLFFFLYIPYLTISHVPLTGLDLPFPCSFLLPSGYFSNRSLTRYRWNEKKHPLPMLPNERP
nr:MAG TPA: hypothetical protein [Bacteriophage sp.]